MKIEIVPRILTLKLKLINKKLDYKIIKDLKKKNKN